MFRQSTWIKITILGFWVKVVMSLDGINSWSIHMLLGEENDLKQSDEIQAIMIWSWVIILKQREKFEPRIIIIETVYIKISEQKIHPYNNNN